jgi:hypothetical protein
MILGIPWVKIFKFDDGTRVHDLYLMTASTNSMELSRISAEEFDNHLEHGQFKAGLGFKFF